MTLDDLEKLCDKILEAQYSELSDGKLHNLSKFGPAIIAANLKLVINNLQLTQPELLDGPERTAVVKFARYLESVLENTQA